MEHENTSNEDPKILVVDDSNFSRALMQRALNEIGIEDHQIHNSGSGTDAISKLQQESFDLFILDIVMENVNGIAVLKEVKKVQPTAKVIMCSGSNSDELVKEVVTLGINEFLVKPFQTKDLKKMVYRNISVAPEGNASRDDNWLAKCHVCDCKMVEVISMNTVLFCCQNSCMQIGPIMKVLATQSELDDDYEKALQKRAMR